MNDQNQINADKLNSVFRLDFAGLDISGNNIEEFYKRRYNRFIVRNSELPEEQKNEILFTFPNSLNKIGTKKIEIEVVVPEYIFIEKQLEQIRRWSKLRERLNSRALLKLDKWTAYLKKKAAEIANPVQLRKYNQPLLSLERTYLPGIPTENEWAGLAKEYKWKNTNQLKRDYRRYSNRKNRYFPNLVKEEVPRAEAQLKRMKTLLEIWSEREYLTNPKHEQAAERLNSEILALESYIGKYE